MVAKVDVEQVQDTEFLSKFADTYLSSVDEALKIDLKKVVLEMRRHMENRLSLSRSGKSVSNGIEFFDNEFYSIVGPNVLNGIGSLEAAL